MKTHKVGQDILFTRQHMQVFGTRPTKTSYAVSKLFWVLGAISLSFFISQSFLLLFGR